MRSERLMRCLRAVLALLAATLIAACASATPEAPAAALADSRWSMTDASFGKPDDTKATLELRAGRLFAHSGCNRASGNYQDLGGKLEIVALMSTKMGCRDALNRFENRYYGLLSSHPAYRIDGNTLTLTAGDDRARFSRSADTPLPPSSAPAP